MKLNKYVFKCAINGFFLTLILSSLVSDFAFAKSGIVINEDEVVVTMTDGYPALKTQIGGETYHFLITPSHPDIWISPEIADKFQLHKNVLKGGRMVSSDTFMYKTKRNKLNIAFSGLQEKEYTVEWSVRPHYEGFDGSVSLSIFKGREISFIFDDKLSKATMKKNVHRQNGGGEWGWRLWCQRFAGKRDFLLLFSPHYDVSRISIGARYAFQSEDNISLIGEPYHMPSDWAGYKEYVRGEFKKPVSPLKGLAPLSNVDVGIKEGSFEKVVETEEDEVVATAKSKREYLSVLHLGRNYFEGCHSIVFPRYGEKLVTYCPNI